MGVAALIVWVATALGGFTLLGMWLRAGGARAATAGGPTTRLAPPLILGHFGLAAGGLVLWIVYLAVDRTGLAWAALAVLVVVAGLGDVMFARWLRAPGDVERTFPRPLVFGHGLLAVTTVVLVLLTALGVGS
jgi:hypothetical protein